MWILVLLACAGKEDDSVAVRDTGPEIEVTPLDFDFGEVHVSGSPSDPADIRITNVGAADLTVASVQIELGSPFTASAADGAVVPGGILHVSVLFDPEAAGIANTTLTVTSDDVDEPTVSVALHGTGI